MLKNSIVVLLILFSIIEANDRVYEDAILDIKDKDYESGFYKLDGLFFRYGGQEEFDFYYGLSALFLKKYHTAISSFERVLIVNPNNNRARLELARALFESGSYLEAKSEFTKVINAKTTPQIVKQKAEKYVKKINDYFTKYKTDGILSVGVGYDSNSYNSYDGDYYINNNKISSSNKNKEDFFHQEFFNYNYRYDIKRRGFWYISSGFTAFNQTYLKEENVNLTYFNFFVAPLRLYNYFNYEFPFKIEKLYYSDEDYLNMVSIGFKFKTTFNKNTKLFFNSEYKNKLYIKDTDKNSNTISLNSKLLFYKLFLKLTTSTQKKLNQNTRVDIDKSTNGIKIGYFDKLLSFYYTYKDYIYKDNSTIFMSKRKDTYNSYSINYSYNFSKKSIIVLNYEFINNISNQKPYNYKKNLCSIKINYKF